MTLSPFQNLAFTCIELKMKTVETEDKGKGLLEETFPPSRLIKSLHKCLKLTILTYIFQNNIGKKQL